MAGVAVGVASHGWRLRAYVEYRRGPGMTYLHSVESKQVALARANAAGITPIFCKHRP